MSKAKIINLGKVFNGCAVPCSKEAIALLSRCDFIKRKDEPYCYRFIRLSESTAIGEWEGNKFSIPLAELQVCNLYSSDQLKSEPQTKAYRVAFNALSRSRLTETLRKIKTYEDYQELWDKHGGGLINRAYLELSESEKEQIKALRPKFCVGDRILVSHYHGANHVPGTIIEWDEDLGWAVQIDDWWKHCQVSPPPPFSKPLGNGWWKSEELTALASDEVNRDRAQVQVTESLPELTQLEKDALELVRQGMGDTAKIAIALRVPMVRALTPLMRLKDAGLIDRNSHEWISLSSPSLPSSLELPPSINKPKPTLIEFFAAGGGVAAGAIDAGIEPVFAVEFDPGKPELSSAIADCHKVNFPVCKVIRKTVQDCAAEGFEGFPLSPDLLWASPVCSNFSVAKNPSAAGETPEDIESAIAVGPGIEILRPQHLLLENVPSYASSKSWLSIKATLGKNGYWVEQSIVNMADYGIPQARKRFIVRASRSGQPIALPPTQSPLSWYEAIEDLIEDLPDRELLPGQQKSLSEWLKGNSPLPLLIGRTGARRECPVTPAYRPSRTILRSHFTDHKGANRNRFADIWLPDGRVKAVSIECVKRLQGFPDWYKLPESVAITGAILGYAVPPRFVELMLRHWMESDADSIAEQPCSSRQRSHSVESSISIPCSKPTTELFLKWAGGKSWAVELVEEIYSRFQDYRLVSLTLGGGAIELGLQPKRALLCDINPYLINCWQWVKEDGRFTISLESSSEYFHLIRDRFNENPLHPDAPQWFYLLNRTCFNGLQRGSSIKHFNVGWNKNKKFQGQTDLSHYKTAMGDWEFKAQGWEQTLLEVQADDFLIFDPPYHGTGFKEYYGKFTDDDQVSAANELAKRQNPVVTFNAATPEILELYSGLGFDVRVVEVARRIACNGDRTPALEMIATKNLNSQTKEMICTTQPETTWKENDPPYHQKRLHSTEPINCADYLAQYLKLGKRIKAKRS